LAAPGLVQRVGAVAGYRVRNVSILLLARGTAPSTGHSLGGRRSRGALCELLTEALLFVHAGTGVLLRTRRCGDCALLRSILIRTRRDPDDLPVLLSVRSFTGVSSGVRSRFRGGLGQVISPARESRRRLAAANDIC